MLAPTNIFTQLPRKRSVVFNAQICEVDVLPQQQAGLNDCYLKSYLYTCLQIIVVLNTLFCVYNRLLCSFHSLIYLNIFNVICFSFVLSKLNILLLFQFCLNCTKFIQIIIIFVINRESKYPSLNLAQSRHRKETSTCTLSEFSQT